VSTAERQLHREVVVFARIRRGESLLAPGRRAQARRELERVLALAGCNGCDTTTAEVQRATVRARILLKELGSATDAAADVVPAALGPASD
jgi:uncharacterized metal-binding protein